MKEKYLPIGTVLLLKDATKMLMITGYCSSTPEDPNKVYDYVACLFPEGGLAGDEVALFNHDQIGTITHMGLDNDEFKELDKKIKVAMANEPPPEIAADLSNLPPFTPENVNMILQELNKHGDDLKPLAEPTAFNEEAIKKPVFDLPSLGGDDKKEEEEKEDEAVPEAEDEEEETVNDVSAASALEGQPVLQLEPIFEGVKYDNAVLSATSAPTEPAGASGNFSGLARL